MALEGLKGLTAQDRANWEKKYSAYLSGKSSDEIERMYRNEMFKAKFKGREDYSTLKQMSPKERDAFYNKSYTDSIEAVRRSAKRYSANNDLFTVKSDATRVRKPIRYELSPQEQEAFKAKSIAYDNAMRKYSSDYAKSAYDRDHAVKDIRTVAESVSPYYRKYKNTDYLPFTNNDWQSIATEYNAKRDAYGEESANIWLQGKMQDTASKNQSLFEKAWNGFVGMGASAAGALIGTYGMLKGAYDYVAGNYKDVKGLNGFENFMNSVMDNDITRFGNDITKYGTIINLNEAKKSGLSELEVIQTQGQQSGSDSLFDQIFNVNTIPVAMQSGGFTVASMLAGYGEAKLAGWAFKGLKGATMLGKTGSTTQKLMQARNTLNAIQKAENFTNKFIIPGLTGTTEGVIEGLNTKLEVLEDSKEKIAKAQSEYVDKRFTELYESEYNKRMEEAYNKAHLVKDRETGKLVSSFDANKESRRILNELYKQAWDEYSSKYKESLEQAEFAASKAGVNNFLVNSAINGVINQTLKAGLQSSTVQGTLQKSRLFNWATPKGKFDITGSGANTTVTPKYRAWKQTWNIAKEPLGEFTEEYLQSVSDATMSGGAANNIHQFIENKYNGDGSAEVGDYMAGDFTAALLSMGESMVDNETIKSGIYGAISSAMGTPVFRGRDYTKRVKGSDGKYHTEIDLSRREGESRLGHITRLMPWRSGITNAIIENAETKRQLYDDAKTLETWLRDPNNKAKFDGIVGTYNWAKQMESDAKSNDEFGYRNSLLGKTINDVFMLDKMRGTQYYDSFMNELITVANLEEGTEQANSYIKSMRDNINTQDSNVSDTEVLNQLKSNANKLLNTINTIQQESDKIDRTLGNIDEDTKQALIFGQMSLQDWDSRSKKIESELGNIASLITDSSKPVSNMSPELRDIVSRYGSLSRAKKVKEELSNSLQSISKDIDNLNNRKDNLIDSEKKILKEKKAKLKSINKVLNTLKNIDNVKEESTVLNESEIMALPAIDRAIMMNRENLSNYSEEQRDIISNLIDRGTSKDINFYNKIQDAGRMELAKQSFLTQYNEILRDPNSFNMYVQRAKQAASDVLTKKKYESIDKISDYKDFALEMDKLMDNGSPREQRLIINALSKSNNSNYERYKNDRKTLEGLFNQVVNDDAFKNIDANDADMFALSLQYLSNNGIDLSDENAVVNSLSEVDSDGNSLFQKYVEDINSNSPDETKVVFTSIGEAIQTYKDVMQNYKRDEDERANNSKPVEVQSTTAEQSAPAKPVNPMPGIFGSAATTLEEANESAKKTVEEQSLLADNTTSATTDSAVESKEDKKSDEKPEPFDTSLRQESNNSIEEFRENSNDDVAKSAELGSRVIRNSSDNYSENAKNTAEEILNSFSKNEFENSDELSEALVQKANQLDISADENDEDTMQASSLLRQAASKITNQAQERKIKEKEEEERASENKKPSLFDRARQKTQDTNRSIFDNNSMSSLIDSSDIQWLRENHPDNPTIKYWEKYNIEAYLGSRKLNTGKEGTRVYFITDNILAQEIKANMESNGANYTNLDIPIIAVVEDENGPLTIGNKKYQPIGTFPSTNTRNYKGIGNVGRIRELVGNQKSGELIRDKNGNILVGSLVSVVAKTPERLGREEINNNIQNLIFDILSEKEKEELKAVSKKDRRSHPTYRRMIDLFLSALREKRRINPKTNREEFEYFYVEIPKLKGNNNTLDSRIFFRYIRNTLSTKSGKLITELFKDNNVEELLTANSRLTKASQVLDDISARLSNSIITTNEEGGQLVPTGESANILNELSDTLTRQMNNRLHLPSQNWKYKISAIKDSEGKRVYHISVSDDNTTIPLTTISGNTISNQEKFDFFKNLIMEGTQTRRNGEFDFIKWQVDIPKGAQTLEDVKTNLITAFNDGILEISHKSVKYKVKGIEVRSPFTSTGETIKPVEVSNPSNATPSTPVNTPTVSATDQVQSDKAIIDSETGTVLEGKAEEKTNVKLEAARVIADRITEDSKLIQLAPDGSGYISTKTGKKYSRVTSIIQADAEAGNRFDPNSPWILPSTNIGTSVDEFVRDFFAGEFHEDGKLIGDFFYDYPNATSAQWKHFVQELQSLKNSFDAMGLTVIPRDVTVTGTLNATDSEGKVHTIDVAGTLDLLAYDQEGNFYIYDMKTVRSSIDQHKEEKYARQLSLYKKFLENTYGINVKSLNIIPIHVEYPEPKGWKNSTNEYTVIEGNQLAINGEEYRNAKPQLFRPKEVGYREPNIQYEKLTDIEKRQTLTKEEQEILNKSPRDSQGRLLAPNGKKSNLTERQYAQVRTKAFKDWFGDWENDPENASKVVDENGEPLVVYHGTQDSFTTVDFSKSDAGQGFYAANDKDTAETYGLNNKYALFFNLKNPYIIEGFGQPWNQLLLNDEDYTEEELKQPYKLKRLSTRDIENFAKNKGYDGVIFKDIIDQGKYSGIIHSKEESYIQELLENSGEDYTYANSKVLDFLDTLRTDVFVVFDSPNQIKSATDNIGTFSRTNNDIYDTISKLISEKDASVNQTSPEVVTPAETKEVEVKEVTVADNTEPTVDLNTGLNIGKVRDRRKKKSGTKVNPKPTRLIPSRLTWGVWEGFTNEDNEPIDVEMTLKDLSKFYTEEQWNQLSDEEMEHELKCKGSFIAK